ncbi:MAG: DNA alkylation repair protein [Porphyromonas sp.]|nr:DNA alkylation repair protein [Porphyromonas sp.]
MAHTPTSKGWVTKRSIQWLYPFDDLIGLSERLCYEEIYSMALSSDLWIKRIGIVSTLGLIRQGILDPTLRVVEANLSHQHHLIHKAMGWMLREVGKRDESRMLNFLELTVAKMPRTTLRYAIERLDTDTRRSLLAL